MYLPCHKASDQILASPRVLVKWPTTSLKIPMLSFSKCWLHLPSVTRGDSTCKPLGRQEGAAFSLALLFVSETNILQKVPGDFSSISMVRIGSYAFPLVVRMVGMQGSHTLSLFIGKWALPAKKGMPAKGNWPHLSHVYPHPLHSPSHPPGSR